MPAILLTNLFSPSMAYVDNINYITIKNQDQCSIIIPLGDTMTQEVSSKLRWACRRGMLELDVLLGNFLENRFNYLTPEDQENFINLLNNNDQDLFTWLIGRELPPNPATINIVNKILEYAKNSH